MFAWEQLLNFQLLAQEGGDESFLVSLLRSPLFPIIMIGLMLYTMFLLPERRKRAEMQAMLGNLKKNDKIVTIGGIFGVVMSADKDEVVIRVDEDNKTRLRIRRSAIQTVLDTESSKADAGRSDSSKSET